MKQLIRIIGLTILWLLVNQRGYSYDFEVGGIYYGFNTSTQTAYVTYGENKYSGIISIPESITFNGRTLDVSAIGSKAFNNCPDLVSVSIPQSITSIGDGAFQGCMSLNTINLPNALTEISSSTFKNCTNLVSIVLPNKISEIGYKSFEGCTKLESINLPESTNVIREYAFGGCISLKAIVIPGSVEKLHDWSFQDCLGLKTIVLEDSDKEIGYGGNLYDRNRAFWGTSPHYIYIGRNIIDNLFYGNGGNEGIDYNNLSTLSIGPSVNSVIITNVSKWSSLKSIYCFSNNPESVEVSFGTNTYVNAKLYVPTGTKDKYLSAKGWKNFFQIEEMDVSNMWDGKDEPPIDEETKEKCEKPTIRYSHGKLLFESATEGAICQTKITNSDITSFSGNEIQLSVTYNISVYATALGYENSEVATATLCWIDVEPKTEGFENSIAQMRATPILIQSNSGTLNIQGAEDGVSIGIYTTSGMMVGSAKSSGTSTSIVTGLKNGEIVIVKIGDKSIKIMMK